MRRASFGVALATAAGLVALASPQQPAAGRASKFDVVSVKPQSEDARQSGRKGPPPFAIGPKRLDARGLTLRSLIAHAYGVDESQVTGGPGWADSERYDVAGAVDAPATREQLLTMLRQALDDRFALQLHRETKTAARYVLAVAKNGPKFGPRFHPGKDSAPPSASPATDPKTMLLKSFTMEHLCFFLTDNRSNWDVEAADDVSLGPVVDQTGLSGVYDISVRWAPRRDWLSVFEGDLGLRVELRKIPSEILVVERAARPAPN